MSFTLSLTRSRLLGSLSVGEGVGFNPVAQAHATPPGAENGLVLKKLLPYAVLLFALSGYARNHCLHFDPFTVVVLPDTQMYTTDKFYDLDLFSVQTEWIVANEEALNIKFVLHEGDLVHRVPPTPDNLEEWARAEYSMSLLDGFVPYAIAPGNHDGLGRSRDAVELNDYFPVSKYEDLPTFGGVFEEGRIENTYHYFSAGGVDWLVLALEFGPRDLVLDWANEVVANHPYRQVMVVTHAYLYSENTLHGSATYHRWNPHGYPVADDPGGVNDGVEIWEKLVRKHENIMFVFSGHILFDGAGLRVSAGDHGNLVYQMLANYQMKSLGGSGFLRIVRFDPSENIVDIETYSPYLDEYNTDPQHQFGFELDIFNSEFIQFASGER